MNSESLALSRPMIDRLARAGITKPTPVQKEIIPAIFAGKDVIAQSETGSGKTLSFAIPILERLPEAHGVVALVLVPTRELCLQIAEEFNKFAHGRHVQVVPVYGGASIGVQMQRLRAAHIVVATPGRLIDLLTRGAVRLQGVQYLVFDEADRMLDMGFIRDIERIVKHVPKERQTLLFSATISPEIDKLSHHYLRNPLRVRLASTVEPGLLKQSYYRTLPDAKIGLLAGLLKNDRALALVFCNRKHITVKVAKRLSSVGIHARCLNGNMSQSQRERVTADFRSKKFTVLVATDVAARGLHIDDVSHVYNYEIPKDLESYTHRIGRTARAGKQGEAISLVGGGDEGHLFQKILHLYKGGIALKSAAGIPMPEVDMSPVLDRALREERPPSRHYSQRPFGHRKGGHSGHAGHSGRSGHKGPHRHR